MLFIIEWLEQAQNYLQTCSFSFHRLIEFKSTIYASNDATKKKTFSTNWDEEIYVSSFRYHRCTCALDVHKHKTLLSRPVIKLWCAHKGFSSDDRRASQRTAEAKNKSTKYEIEYINQLPNLTSLLPDPIQGSECCRGWQRLITTQRTREIG